MHPQENNRVFLVHWTYSKEEWKMFQHWNSRRQGLWNFFLFKLFPNLRQRVPEVAITEHKIWIGDTVHSFRDNEKQLKRIHIREAAKMNVIEIRYEKINGKQVSYGHICVPIPKGKLREAMQVHENLSAHAW